MSARNSAYAYASESGVWRAEVFLGTGYNARANARHTAREAIISALVEREQKRHETSDQCRARISSSLGHIVALGEFRPGVLTFAESDI